MKKIFLVFTVIFTVLSSFAQINEGRVVYGLSFNSSDPSVNAQLAMLQGATMTIYFSTDYNRVEMNMGMFVQTTTIVDLKSEETLLLMEGLMGKKASTFNAKDTEGENVEEEDEIKIEKTNETKKIAGFKCEKHKVITDDGSILNVWSTNELSASKAGMKYINDKISGYPLEFEIITGEMTMIFSAKEVEKSLKKYKKKELFDMTIPDGYEKVDFKDLQGGGMF